MIRAGQLAATPSPALIVEIDEMARVDFESQAARDVGARVERLFEGAFNERYVPVLQRDVDVAVAHAAIAKGAEPAEALRTAKLALLNSDRANRPVYWAPFVVYEAM